MSRPIESVKVLDARALLPRREALTLLAHACGCSREQLLAGTKTPSADAEACFERLAARRAQGEPLAYLVGEREFYGRRFMVDRRVLIPRPETEGLVDVALEWLAGRRGAARIADLGTGSGALAITLALETGAAVVGTDASPLALEVARANAARLEARVHFVDGDWCGALDGRFDCIVSNPPYIADGDRHLAEGDLRFEPRDALTDGSDGLRHLDAIVACAPRYLAPDGLLVVEHGYDQAPAVRRLFADAGFVAIMSRCDLAGLERSTHGTRGTADL